MKKSVMALLYAGCASFTAPALAQVASTDRPAAAETPFGEEIIVTARKRQESLLDVPVVIAAISQEQLQRAQMQDLKTIATRVPGLLVASGSGSIGGSISLRGIGTSVQTPTIDQSVSLNVDGLQLSQSFALESAMFDLGQVEVLKGPQALFFGKNSPAGVISLRTADPGDRTEIILRAGYEFEASEKLAEAVISGPVSDTLKLRLAGRYFSNRGIFNNYGVAPEGVGMRTPTTTRMEAKEGWILRGTAVFTPSDNYDLRLKANFTRDSMKYSGGESHTSYCPGGLTSFTGLPVFDPNDECKVNGNFYFGWADTAAFPLVRNGGVPFLKSHSEFGTLEQNLRLGDELTLSSVTGLYHYAQKNLVNGIDTAFSPYFVDNDFSNRQFSQELRLASDFSNSDVNFLIGGFYQNALLKNHPRIFFNTSLSLPPVLFDARHEVKVESLSGFGQLRWKVTDKVELSGGARVTHETRRQKEFNVATPGFPTGEVDLLTPRLKVTNVSPEFTVSYKPTDDLMLYAANKQGFKSGSFNTVIFYDSNTPTAFGDEEVKGGEVGLKAQLFDRRLNFNLAAYYYRYNGLQVGTVDTTSSGALALRTLNAASATVKGIELDATYRVPGVDGLTLRGSANYNRARYKSFRNAPCEGNQTIAQGCDQLYSPADDAYFAQDLSGRPLVAAPEWMTTAGFDYEMPVGDMTLALGGNVLYSSSYYTNLLTLRGPGYVQPGYAKVNANVALRGPEDAWELALIGNNITDKVTTSSCVNANLNGGLIFGGQQAGKDVGGPAGSDYATCKIDRGRILWLRATVKFGN